MIISIEGTIEFVGEKYAIIKTGNGVGYKVFLSEDTIRKIPEKDTNVKFWTHHHVREDISALYGFLAFSELDLFERLISISGIGPKGALGVLGVAPVDTLKKAIAAGDTSYLTRVSGIGKKMAEKIVLELKDKLSGKSAVTAPELQEEADALDALITLGYSHIEARTALAKVPLNIRDVGMRVKEALKKL